MARIRCKKCLEVLESRYRHDFKMCKCINQAFVDGGDDYCRCGAVDMNEIEIIDNDIDIE